MKAFGWNMLLALAWLVLSGTYTISNFFAGMLLSYVVLAYVLRDHEPFKVYFGKLPKMLNFILFFIWDLIKANARVAYDVVTPTHLMKPAVIAVPLDIDTEGGITIFSTLITVTPGSLALDVSTDKKVLYVHLMYFEDEKLHIAELKRLEAMVIDLLG
ncbi:Na+/H+ antiporter subunit E [Vibrio genomosp. F10]|uniref:Cation:proton antiporter n=2 Tax=Vibrio genomosp. F10 TaxID=723171 RepID=A0A1B9QWJ5_9VIBR|nr:Na+/H+ antiporter subunit E [Vibrio genomosp. F10]OCH73977.1 cation:proton antiporter [Vibrio genomosp. F10]OEE32642.1 cation:proton antiporter [Vibrio genomosp. F10 str. ZF-129]OEE91897.1 cation:proton antiporter [Vibrio genomosp. F10 str. 9ZD137]OEE98392.1 cation:proton antiporter [Vibrio genomosp. F10 str. 9ZC157]